MSDLSRNLQILCERFRSVSELCRELDINRQQFARYLNGTSSPSAYNLRKIAGHFSIPVVELYLDQKEFAKRHAHDRKTANPGSSLATAPMRGVSLGNVKDLKGYTGYYFSYLQTPSAPAMLLQSLVHLHFDGTNVLSTMEESTGKTLNRARHRWRYEGVASLMDGCLFIVDIETTSHDSILETILRVPYRRKRDVLFGVIMGMTTGHRRIPFASITAWKFLGKKINVPSRVGQCGFYNLNAKSIDPVVREAFVKQDQCFLYPRLFDST